MSICTDTQTVCVCVCVKEGVFLEDQGMLVGGCQALEESVEGRISVAFVGIYSHNKDLVGDTRAGCVYIKEASQRGAATHQETLLLLLLGGRGELGESCLYWFFFGKGRQSQDSVCDECMLEHCCVHASVCFIQCVCRCEVF